MTQPLTSPRGTYLPQALLHLIVETVPMRPNTTQNIASWAKTIATPFLRQTNSEIALGRHPLHTFYCLLKKALEQREQLELPQALGAVPERLRNAIFYEVWSQATDPNKEGERWGEIRALDNLPRLMSAVKIAVEKRLDSLSAAQKNDVYFTIYDSAGRPITDDHQWGEHHAKDNLEKLICALHRCHHLEVSGKKITHFPDLEKGLAIPSRLFQLNRPELSRGQIGLHNGMNCTFVRAFRCALDLSTQAARSYNLHCTYSATAQPHWDAASVVLGQGGIITPPVLKLLEQWQDFFEKNDQDRLLQICHSRGAIEVNNALALLPPELKQRIIVVAVAPGRLLSPDAAYRVINLLNPHDPVPKIAVGQEHMEAPHTIKVHDPEDTANVHTIDSPCFQEKLASIIGHYIDNNDIPQIAELQSPRSASQPD